MIKKPTLQSLNNYTINNYSSNIPQTSTLPTNNNFQTSNPPLSNFSNTPYLTNASPKTNSTPSKQVQNLLSPNSKMKLNPF